MSDQVRRLRVGAEATGVMFLVALIIWGWPKAQAAMVLGMVATAMQLFAAYAMRRTGVSASVDHLKVYLFGMVLRMAGVGVMALLVIRDPARFGLWPSALGYLGTVLPLLYLETRLAK